MIDLAAWNLTIPVGTLAKVIDTPRLVDGYSDKYFRSGEPLFFWAPVTGASTSKSEFPRSELRETLRRDAAQLDWKNKPLYFKAGVYALDNTGYKNEGGQVTFSQLDVAPTKP